MGLISRVSSRTYRPERSRHKMTSEAQILHTIETGHEDVINDAILDYYGTTLATASNDKTIKLFDVRNGQNREIAKMTDHTGQIWQLAWAHPFFGQVLASCSYDGECIIYKKNEQTQKRDIFHRKKYSRALNSVCWAPPEFGLRLAIASSEEDIIILTYNNDNKDWDQTKVPAAHSMGVKAVSWAPGNMPSSLFQKDTSQGSQRSCMRLVSGGDESKVRIWRYDDRIESWIPEDVLEGHKDWIRDVAWAPNIGLPEEQIASCSTDKRVIIWSRSLNTAQQQEASDDQAAGGGGGTDTKT